MLTERTTNRLRRDRGGRPPCAPRACSNSAISGVRAAAGLHWMAAVGRGFSLVELLVVIAIIGILAASSIPAIKSLTHANTLAASNRQVLDDLAGARQLAINGRRTVYVVFVPPTMRDHFQQITSHESGEQRTRDLRRLTNLVSGQYTAYALFTKRSVGDQPGLQNPRYLSEWKQLPEGMLISTNKFRDLGKQWLAEANKLAETNRPLPYADFPFPSASSWPARLPYIAFNAKGQITHEEAAMPKFAGEAVGLTRGSIFYYRDAKGAYDLSKAPDVVETPRANQMNIRVNWLTGRAKVDQLELK